MKSDKKNTKLLGQQGEDAGPLKIRQTRKRTTRSFGNKNQKAHEEINLCSYCNRSFSCKRGLSIHVTRFCKPYITTLVDGEDYKSNTVNIDSVVQGIKPTKHQNRSDFIHSNKIKIQED